MAVFNPSIFFFFVVVVVTLLTAVSGFSISSCGQLRSLAPIATDRTSSSPTKGSNLYMGRHAVVRALTKARTDGAKSKNNSR